jgi:formylglycine-generating enzyme required for sulfatase activity
MQLPSIDDMRATGMLLAAADHAVEVAPVDATAEYPAQRPSPGSTRWRPSAQLLRALPLAALCALGAAVLTLSIASTRSEVDAAPAVTPSTAGAAPTAVLVEAIDATIGLTEDNKEAVLSLCFRASDNPNTECRRAHLEELGEFPSQTVPFDALNADVFEVANAWYDACVAAGDCTARDVESCQYYTVRRRELGRAVPETLLAADRPAVCVTRGQAEQFCVSRGMRLPTGAEWERLARAGTDRLQPWGNFWTPAILNWGERDMVGFPVAGRLDGHELTAPVDAFFDGRTTEGLHQFFGNAAEWTGDDGEGSGMGEVRGGSYADDARTFRATRVTEVPVGEARTTVGFRCVGDPH